MNIPESNVPRVVIIGGGFAGLHLAKKLKGKRFQVVMIDRNNYHTFQPLLYQVATAGLEPDSIAYPLRKIFKSHENFYFRMAKVSRVDTESKNVITEIGEISYDYLVLATGTTTNFFGMNDMAENAMSMKSISEALDLRSYILQHFEKALLTSSKEEQEALMSIAIVGGGPTGVELAGAFAELKKHILPADYPDLDIRRMNIHLIEMADELLPPMSARASKKAFQYLEELGVTIWLKKAVESYDGMTVKFKEGKVLKAKTLIWAAGVKGNLVQGVSKDVIKKGRYEVDRQNRIVGYENVFAIGDLSLMQTDDFPEGLPMLAPVATQQGEFLAKNLEFIENNKALKDFKYNDRGVMATVGRNRAVVDLNNIKFQGLFAWYVWMFVHLISLVGFRNKIVTFFNWSYNYLNFDRGIRLIIRKFEKKKQTV
ncbi:MAG: FAD-dependent oxidoreductase [Flavobacteriales bacterium]|nr:FAD-dependent oxidoreductase [Flavobacteriales bacterium]|tara:strand:+ start:2382 stop:3662 length:1281 start_codon:yes stop_codon:yes gene_type:complete